MKLHKYPETANSAAICEREWSRGWRRRPTKAFEALSLKAFNKSRRRERVLLAVNFRHTWLDHTPCIGVYLVELNLGNEREKRVVLSPKGPLARFPPRFGYVRNETGACLTRPSKTRLSSWSSILRLLETLVPDQKSISLDLLNQLVVFDEYTRHEEMTIFYLTSCVKSSYNLLFELQFSNCSKLQ